MRHLTRQYLLVLVVGLASVVAVPVLRLWKAKADRKGQESYRAYIDTAEAEFRSGVVH